VPPSSLITASVEDLAGPAPSDTLSPLGSADVLNQKCHQDYRDCSILSKRQTSFHCGPREATGLQHHATMSVSNQPASLSQTRHAT
jgi:hypothetical protein